MRSRRRLIVAAVAVVAVIAVGAVVVSGGGEADTPAAASQATATAGIRRQDLVETETVDGTLGYSGARTAVTRLAGTVTWTPRVGSVVRTNHRLYEVDGRAIYLLDGASPAYRTLGPGLTGDDVRQFERNLRQLGLDGNRMMHVDDKWDADTTAAAMRWQGKKGLTEDGTVERGTIVFQPGPRRISEIQSAVGSNASGAGGGGGQPPPGGGEGAGPPAMGQDESGGQGPDVAAPLMTTTSTKRVVVVDLEATKQALARRGAAVTVTLPDDSNVAGKITRVGKVAEKKPTPQNEDPPATIQIAIKLRRSTSTGLDQAPVDVKLEKQRAKDVLVVPVTALLARAGGEFAVEVREGDRRRVVPVETGLYTESFVEIEGNGLRPGLKVTDARI